MRFLGIDYGEKRIGIAVSDPTGSFAMPREVVQEQNEKSAFKAIKAICEDAGIEKVVVGMPYNMDGTKGPMTEKVEAFSAGLSAYIGLPVEGWDERLSSSAAEKILLEADMSRAKRKKVRDKLAAQVILQGYLDGITGELTANGAENGRRNG